MLTVRGDESFRGWAELRVYGPLNHFLPVGLRQVTIRRALDGSPAVKDVVEAIGIPHPEIGLIVINGEPAGFGQRVANGDRIAVYPPFRSIPIGSALGGEPVGGGSAPARFVADGHLGRLVAYLRMCGFDTAYDSRADDAQLASRSAVENRILLTRDRGLLKRSIVTLGYLVRSDQPSEQLVEVIERFDLAGAARPFGRCLRCNGELVPAERTAVAAEVPPRVFAEQPEFRRCPACRSIYWRGSHHARMERLLLTVLPATGSSAGFGAPGR